MKLFFYFTKYDFFSTQTPPDGIAKIFAMDTHTLLEQVEAILDTLDDRFLPHRPMMIRRRKSIIAVAKAMAQGSNYRDVLGKDRPEGTISKRVFFEAKKPYWHAQPVREAITAVAEVYTRYYTCLLYTSPSPRDA